MHLEAGGARGCRGREELNEGGQIEAASCCGGDVDVSTGKGGCSGQSSSVPASHVHVAAVVNSALCSEAAAATSAMHLQLHQVCKHGQDDVCTPALLIGRCCGSLACTVQVGVSRTGPMHC